VEATEAPAATETVSPQAADIILWTPASGALQINNAGQVTVRVSSNEGDLDPSSARFQLVVSGVFQPIQVASAAAVGNNATLDLTASGLGGVNAPVTQILFKVNRSGGSAVPDSALYSLTRSSRAGLPITHRNAGASTIPRIITQTGANSCDAFINRRGSPLGSYVNYTVNGTAGQSWFWAVNPRVGATLVVSLTNYNVPGQLQVYSDVSGVCSNLTPLLAFGANPNPVVALGNAPTGNIYFRVVSADTVTPPPPYNISWGWAGSGGVGGTGSEIEPNNNTCQATALPERAVFTATDNDQFDFFSIAITQSGQIMMLVEGNQTVGTQIQARAPVAYNGFPEQNCQSTMPTELRKDPYTEPIGNVPTPGASVLTRSGIVLNGGPNGDNAGTVNPAQTWFIRVATPNAGGQSNKPYTIRWAYLPPGVTSYPFTDKLTQSGPANGNDPLLRVNDPFGANTREKWYYSYFWANMDKIPGGIDTIQFGIDSWTLDGCPSNVFPPDPGRTVPPGFAGNWVTVTNQPSGVMTWKMNKSGAYRIRFRALKSGNVVRSDEKAIRVDCGFQTYNFGGLWPFSVDAEVTPVPESPVIGPEKPAAWVEPIP
jgi:hypothetical protein